MDTESFKSSMENKLDLKDRMKWRYRLEWREENKRLREVYKEWNDGLGYWLFAEGTVTEKLNLELLEGRRREAMQGMTVLDKIRQDLVGNPGGISLVDRKKWKTDAMERIAKKHQDDYDRKDYQVSAVRLLFSY